MLSYLRQYQEFLEGSKKKNKDFRTTDGQQVEQGHPGQDVAQTAEGVVLWLQCKPRLHAPFSVQERPAQPPPPETAPSSPPRPQTTASHGVAPLARAADASQKTFPHRGSSLMPRCQKRSVGSPRDGGPPRGAEAPARAPAGSLDRRPHSSDTTAPLSKTLMLSKVISEKEVRQQVLLQGK